MNLIEKLKPEFTAKLTECKNAYPFAYEVIHEALSNNKYITSLSIFEASYVMRELTDNRYLDLSGIFELFEDE